MKSTVMQRDTALLSVPRRDLQIGPVIACALGRHFAARLGGALRGRAEVQVVSSFAELRLHLQTSVVGYSAIVVPPRDFAGVEAFPLVREISVQRPRTAVHIHIVPDERGAPDLRTLALAGAHQFVFAGIDDVGVAFRTVLDKARRQCAAECIMRELESDVPEKLHPVLEIALNRQDSATSVRALASAVGIRRTTLAHWCARERFLVPEEFLTWARLALVAYYLESTGCTIEAIAQELSYPSDTALRNTVKRYLGRRASELRSAGGLKFVVVRFRSRIRSRFGQT